MPETVKILGVDIHKINMEESLLQIKKWIEKNSFSHMVFTPNAEMTVKAHDDPAFRRILNGADLRVPDGAGILLASRLLGSPVQERVAGFDLLVKLCQLAHKKDYTAFFLGAKPGIAKKAAESINRRGKSAPIVGYHHGYLDHDEKVKAIEEINKLSPDILFVGMGVPLQEKFVHKNLHKLNVRVAVTIGGSFDVLAGEVKRAPTFMQKMGMEWFYRLLQEPQRLGRMMALPRFILLILKEKYF
ncbi:MAG: WecB/TagA/CpsF family glycosyltransferase [Halanaerobiales bacterium]